MAKKKEAKKAEKVMKKNKPVKAKKIREMVTKGRAYIVSSFNNTVVTLTDESGRVLSASSGGVVGFKGTRKSTPYAASRAAEDAVTKSVKYGLKEVDIFVKGPGPGRQMAVKAIRSAGLKVTSLSDITPIPHNGCRPKKRPRK
jgi:small subunit ribosomal protein S11